MRVLFHYDIGAEAEAHLRARLDGLQDAGGAALELVFSGGDDERNRTELPEARVVVGYRITGEQLLSAAKLELWINPWAGVQQLVPVFQSAAADFEQAYQRPLLLANSHSNARFTAQHAVALLLTLGNQVVQHHQRMLAGKWRAFDDELPSRPLTEAKVGLLGYGAVNRFVHQYLAGFETQVSALKRSWPERVESRKSKVEAQDREACEKELTLQKEYALDELDDFLSHSDIVVIAVPATSETEGLIGARELELLGPRGLLVNIARGSVVDEAALYNALAEGTIAGAAIDVWYEYRPEADKEGRLYPYNAQHPFHELPNVVLSPHRAASPLRHLSRWDDIIENIRRVAAGETPINLVNLAAGY